MVAKKVGEQYPQNFMETDKPKKVVLDMVAKVIDSASTLGFFQRMDLRDYLYSESVLRGKAQKTIDGVTYVLVCVKNEYVDPIAKAHTPYYIPRSIEEIMAEHWLKKGDGHINLK